MYKKVQSDARFNVLSDYPRIVDWIVLNLKLPLHVLIGYQVPFQLILMNISESPNILASLPALQKTKKRSII